MISKLTMRGAKFAEVPVNHYFRVSGKSEFLTLKEFLKQAPIFLHYGTK